jgi:hypothetical protein
MSTQLSGGGPPEGPLKDETVPLPPPEGQCTGRDPFLSNVSSPQVQETASWPGSDPLRALKTSWSTLERQYKILERTGDVVLVEVRNQARIYIGYEVAIVRVAPAKLIFGKEVPRREIYPSSAKNSDDWGRFAWSYGPTQLAAARERIARILAARSVPKPEDLAPQIRTATDQTSLRVLARMIRTNGRTMHQIWREGNVAIYCDASKDPKNLGNANFEVIIVRQAKPHPRDPLANRYDLIEVYPNSEEWGDFGWTFTAAFPHSVGCKHTDPADRKDPFKGALCKVELIRQSRDPKVTGIVSAESVTPMSSSSSKFLALHLLDKHKDDS